ncbi:hypothetical protein GMORB2_6945 [Geosmithia morbida]|uniref:Uncharacterized protein n=1 Tax=Geosmithia morbida TaxID=1094350 RepID=A0A9P4YVV7_9HYPO|nr:uncharacterized protein GMORB2_6945 [Geosmithia morbida]KAF4122638.1 hypothetical protein GMORB2_6945 [Geosmithia morbida]
MLSASRQLGPRAAMLATRPFHTSTRRMAGVAAAAPHVSAPLPAKRPVGAFRGRFSTINSLFGFLLGTALSGSVVYTYLIGEYKTSNDLLSEDIYTLQASVSRLTSYVQNLEQRLVEKKK